MQIQAKCTSSMSHEIRKEAFDPNTGQPTSTVVGTVETVEFESADPNFQVSLRVRGAMPGAFESGQTYNVEVS